MKAPVPRLVFVLVPTLMVAFACAPPDDWQGTIEEVDGVVWVNNPAEESGQAPGGLRISLELEQTFGAEEEPDEELLAFVTGIAVDDEGNVYVVDRSSDQLVAFSPDGAVMWRAGRSGQGPGEFDGPNFVTWDGDGTLYVDNQSAGQIEAWSTSGEYLDTQKLSSFGISHGWVAGVPAPDTVVLRSSSRTEGDGHVIHVFDVSDGWRRTAEFFALGGRVADTDEPAPWADAPVCVDDGTIWIGNKLRYELREYALDGTLLRVVTREHPELIPYFVYRGTGFGLGSFAPPMWLGNGHGVVPRYWLVGVTDVEELKRGWDRYLASRNDADDIRSFESALDLVDAEGRVLGSLPLEGMYEEIGWPELTGPDGKLYTRVFEPYPHVRRYRVQIDDS